MFHKVYNNYSSMKKPINNNNKESEVVKIGEGLKNMNINNNNKPLENKNFINNTSTVKRTIKLKI